MSTFLANIAIHPRQPYNYTFTEIRSLITKLKIKNEGMAQGRKEKKVVCLQVFVFRCYTVSISQYIILCDSSIHH